MSERPEIAITSGQCAGRRFSIGDGGVRLGRSSSNDIQIPDAELSRNHCLFEPDGESSVRIIDLASANGTVVNGSPLGSDALTLKPGDVIELGRNVLRVVMPGEDVPPPPSPPSAIDLGLDGGGDQAASAAGTEPPARKRNVLANILWAASVAIMAATIVVLLFFSDGGGRKNPSAPQEKTAAKVKSAPPVFRYERIEADDTHIYRYAAEVDAARNIKVVFDDFPDEMRSDERETRLPDWAEAELARLFASDDWKNLEKTYSGPSAASENALKSWRLAAVAGGEAREVKIENTIEPAGFKKIRESLEAMANGALGMHSVMRSRSELLASSEHSELVGDEKWDQRLLSDGNAFEAIRNYKLAKNDLASLRNETQAMGRIQTKIEKAEAFLDGMYRDAHAEAERAKGIRDWKTAREKYGKICNMIPDKSDERHSAAHAELVICARNIEAMEKGSKR